MEFRPLRPEEAGEAAVLFDEARAGMREMGLDQWQHGVPGLPNARHDAAAGTGRALAEDGALCAVCTLLPDGEPDYAEIEGAWPSGAAPYLTVHRVTVRRACRGHRRRGIRLHPGRALRPDAGGRQGLSGGGGRAGRTAGL